MFKALQSFRGIGAILVMLSHVHINQYNGRIYHSGGPAGVEYFLLLSGFVMCVAYEYAFSSGTFEYRNYLKKRLIRIMPMCWLALIFASIPHVICHTFDIRTFLLNIFALQAWHPDWGFGINVPSWCLAPILLFYVLFPTLYRFMCKYPRRFFAATCVLGLALTIANICLPDIEDNIWYTRYFPPARLFDFMVGMLLWSGYKQLSATKALDNFSYLRRSMIEVAVVAFWIIIAVIVARFEEDSLWFTNGSWLLPSALIIFVFAVFNENGGIVSKMLSWRPLVYLGDISFTLYMFHYTCPGAVNLGLRKFVGHHVQPFDPVTIALGIVAALVVSVIVDRYLDKPIGNYLRKTFIARPVRGGASQR